MSPHTPHIQPSHAAHSSAEPPSSRELKRLLQARAQAPHELSPQHSFQAVMGRAQARATKRPLSTWAWLMSPPLALGAVALSALLLWTPSVLSPKQSALTRGGPTQDAPPPQDELTQRALTLTSAPIKAEPEWLEPLTWGDGWLESEEWAPSWEEL